MTGTPSVVSFHGHDLITIQDGDTIRVAMKPITDAIGLQWDSQFRRINRHPVLKSTVAMMAMVAQDGKTREVVTLPLTMLNGWLFGIDANRVKPEIRDTLLMYQRECFQALYDYWNKGIAINPRITLTPEHQHGLKAEVDKRVYVSVNDASKRKYAYSKIWNFVKDRFKVAEYRDILDSDYTQALAAVHAAPLESPRIEPSLPVLDDITINRIHCLCAHFDALHRIFHKYDMYEVFGKLGSRAGIEMIDHIKDGTYSSHHLQKLVDGVSRYGNYSHRVI